MYDIIYDIIYIYDIQYIYMFLPPSIDVSKCIYDGTTLMSQLQPQVAYLNLSQVAALQAWHLPQVSKLRGKSGSGKIVETTGGGFKY